VATKVVEGNPADEPARNNVAMLSLLRGERLKAALDDAAALYKKSPEHPGIASTYAFALHVHGRTEEGLEIMRKLDPQALLSPSIAAYYGMLLAAKGESEAAKPYLDAGNRAQLLPEERALLVKATETGATAPAEK
jgi:Flp pilus assembly protein TadD